MGDSILESLAEYIASEILNQPRRVISADEALISSGLIDSFHLVDLAVFVETSFGVRLEDTELNRETFDSLASLVALIRQRQAG
jgi:acyl carrier protein